MMKNCIFVFDEYTSLPAEWNGVDGIELSDS